MARVEQVEEVLEVVDEVEDLVEGTDRLCTTTANNRTLRMRLYQPYHYL
jgi:tRNA C32,U32 (ribose-2'-O)-methylase TrmJ